MSTKEELLELFENNKGSYFSGEEIAERLNVSRAAVWKAVNVLRSDGYDIDAVQNKGYSLSTRTDILSSKGIEKYLTTACSGLNIEVLPTTNSTNAVLKEKAVNGAAEGTCVIANNQTAGKGRVGRSFYSPSDSGIYMSILLRPKQFSAEESVKVTTMAAVAVCEAIETISPEPAYIKWVNDIYVNGRKVCGILTEASFSIESGFLDYAVLGIGINAYFPKGGFPSEISDVAGSVFEEPQNDGKNRIAAEVFNRFMEMYLHDDTNRYVEEYHKRSFLIGKEVNVLLPNGIKPASVLDVDDNCHLIVKYENGEVCSLSSGEVSLDISALRKIWGI